MGYYELLIQDDADEAYLKEEVLKADKLLADAFKKETIIGEDPMHTKAVVKISQELDW